VRGSSERGESKGSPLSVSTIKRSPRPKHPVAFLQSQAPVERSTMKSHEIN